MSPNPIAACHTTQGLHHVSFLAQMKSSVPLQAVPRGYVLKGNLHVCFSFKVSPWAKHKTNAQISGCKFFQQICPERAERSQGSCKRGGRKAAGLGLRVGCELQSYVNLFSLSFPICTTGDTASSSGDVLRRGDARN